MEEQYAPSNLANNAFDWRRLGPEPSSNVRNPGVIQPSNRLTHPLASSYCSVSLHLESIEDYQKRIVDEAQKMVDARTSPDLTRAITNPSGSGVSPASSGLAAKPVLRPAATCP